MFSISFIYQQSRYEALIRLIKEKDNRKEYRITVMNGELEVLLHGHHMMTEENGKLDFPANGLSSKAAKLKAIIADEFALHLAGEFTRTNEDRDQELELIGK